MKESAKIRNMYTIKIILLKILNAIIELFFNFSDAIDNYERKINNSGGYNIIMCILYVIAFVVIYVGVRDVISNIIQLI